NKIEGSERAGARAETRGWGRAVPRAAGQGEGVALRPAAPAAPEAVGRRRRRRPGVGIGLPRRVAPSDPRPQPENGRFVERPRYWHVRDFACAGRPRLGQAGWRPLL